MNINGVFDRSMGSTSDGDRRGRGREWFLVAALLFRF